MEGITFRRAGPEDVALLLAIPDGLFGEGITAPPATACLADRAQRQYRTSDRPSRAALKPAAHSCRTARPRRRNVTIP